MTDKKDQETHPAYGMIALSRVMGGDKRLFGSALPRHESTIMLRICAGVREHNLSYDSFYAKKQYIEIEMSPAQFTEMITSMNGSHGGVPCTIRTLDGKSVPPIPQQDTIEAERVKKGFSRNINKFLDKFGETVKTYTARLHPMEKAPLTKEEKSVLRAALLDIDRELRDAAPWMVQMFQEDTEKVVTAAKMEVDAFVQHAIVQKGLEAIHKERFLMLPKATQAGWRVQVQGDNLFIAEDRLSNDQLRLMNGNYDEDGLLEDGGIVDAWEALKDFLPPCNPDEIESVRRTVE